MESAESKRRLATILAADVAGYSKLMAQDEEATVRTLRSYREIIDKLIARHDGRIFNTAGDAVLAEFGSAVEAVRCAITIQDELRVRNAELVPDRQMLFRIGVNVGDVLIEGTDLLGDGVNIAARLEGVAKPGGVCISGSTFEQVKNKLSIGFEDLGPQQVKNIPEPIPAFGITSAPVSVVGETGTSKTAKAREKPRDKEWKRPAAIAAALAFLVVIGGAAFWQFSQRGPTAVASFPENFSIDKMRADEIAALMTGVTISGRRRIDDQPFTILLNPDRTVSYTFTGSGNLSGKTISQTGKWWTEDFRFCVQIPKFAFGQQACPRIVKNGQNISAIRPANGERLPWTISK
jgi:adenylate cyclase